GELRHLLGKIADRKWTVDDLVVYCSLLPFGFNAMATLLNKGEYIPHPTVSSWEIKRDGTVHIPEVALLTILGDDDEVNWVIEGPDHVDGKEFDEYEVNLNRWLRGYVPEMTNYAVCTHFTFASISGVLLKEVNPCQLIKVGNFDTCHNVSVEQKKMI